MSFATPLPQALRQKIAHDLTPAAPFASPGRRAGWFGFLGAVTIALAALRLAQSGGVLAPLSLAVAVAEWLTGLALVWVAMREGVPGLGLGSARAGAALAAGLFVQLAAGFALASSPATSGPGSGGFVAGLRCAAGEGAFGLPLLAAALWLLLRAFPVRPRLASALAGGAAGLLADSVWHLVCSRSDLAHLLVWHFGSTLLLAAAGFLAGVFAERRELNT